MESGMGLGVVLVLCTTCQSISLVRCNLPSKCSSLLPLRPQRFTSMDLSMSREELLEGRHWKILKEMGIPDHLTCLLRNLYAGQEAKIPHAPRPAKKTEHKQQKQYCNKFNKDFKNGPYIKKS